MVKELKDKRDDFTALRAILESVMKLANGRTLVLPKHLQGKYLPCIFERLPSFETLPKPQFERERAEAFAALRQAREDYEARQADRRDRHAERFLGTRPRGRVLTAVEFEARQKERIQREARVAQNRAARNAECQERRGAAGQGGGKGKKGKAA